MNNNEKLVQASLYPEKILARSWYFSEELEGSVPEIWLRESVYEKLLAAAESLPKNLRFVIWDGWRSYELQCLLFSRMTERLRMKGLSDEEARKQASVFVAVPSKEPETVSAHLTGGAIDLTIADIYGHYLPMGGNFDETEEHSYTNYYEDADKQNIIARDNRRLLVSTMENAGFSNYPSEWWHFDYGNKNWAKRKGKQCEIYGYIEPPYKWH